MVVIFVGNVPLDKLLDHIFSTMETTPNQITEDVDHEEVCPKKNKLLPPPDEEEYEEVCPRYER